MSEKNKILYSDPINEIISVPPGRIIRNGTTVIFVVLLILIIMAWIIRYPDVVPAPIEITTVNPPVTLVTKVSGRINRIMVKDGDKVNSGSLLAVMETTASLDDILSLKSIIDTVRNPVQLINSTLPELPALGDIQQYYATFLKALSDYNIFVRNDIYGSRIRSLKEELGATEKLIRETNLKEKFLNENLGLQAIQFSRDSSLFSKNVNAASVFEMSRQTFNKSRVDLQEVRISQSQASITLAEKKLLVQEYDYKRKEEKQNLISLLNEAFMNLSAQLRAWENKYLLVTPVNGTVTFTRYWSENQSVIEGEHVLNVVPDSAGKYIGRITLSMQRSGKVKTGMPVNIKLSGFPYLEFGMVHGYVRSKSLVPSSDAYIVEVELPQGLRTLYNRQLDFTQNMQGTAEIKTDSLRLLQRIINPFRYVVSKNRN
jgi:multidrug efflux pump subunit AcrA (membrane-fusion protein)